MTENWSISFLNSLQYRISPPSLCFMSFSWQKLVFANSQAASLLLRSWPDKYIHHQRTRIYTETFNPRYPHDPASSFSWTNLDSDTIRIQIHHWYPYLDLHLFSSDFPVLWIVLHLWSQLILNKASPRWLLVTDAAICDVQGLNLVNSLEQHKEH